MSQDGNRPDQISRHRPRVAGRDPERDIANFSAQDTQALRRAVLDTFDERALIQRCRAHKKRNVTDALPDRMRPSVRTAMNQSYATGDPERARRPLENLAYKLESADLGTAASLREGVDETLTVMALQHLSEGLDRVLSSTNL